MHCPGFSTGHALKMAHTEATAAKNQGNACFKKRDWAGAIVAYSEGVAIDPTWEVLYSNRSQAYFQLKKYEKAYADAQSCMKVKPDYVKGDHRGANALVRMDRYTDALAVLDAGYKKGFRANKDLSKLDDLIRPKAEIRKHSKSKKCPAWNKSKRREMHSSRMAITLRRLKPTKRSSTDAKPRT